MRNLFFSLLLLTSQALPQQLDKSQIECINTAYSIGKTVYLSKYLPTDLKPFNLGEILVGIVGVESSFCKENYNPKGEAFGVTQLKTASIREIIGFNPLFRDMLMLTDKEITEHVKANNIFSFQLTLTRLVLDWNRYQKRLNVILKKYGGTDDYHYKVYKYIEIARKHIK